MTTRVSSDAVDDVVFNAISSTLIENNHLLVENPSQYFKSKVLYHAFI
jgi:hypothetical protein